MSIWLIFLGLTFIAFLAGILYLISRIERFNFIVKLSKDKKWAKRGISLALILLVVAVLIIIWSMINAMIVLLHFVMIWLICDLVSFIIKKVKRHHNPDSNPDFSNKPYITGIFAVSLTVIYLSVSYFLAHNVWVTTYTLTTDKDIQPLRIAMFADSHVGTLEDGEGFARKISVINDYNPDIIVIPGDFVDDNSSLEDMTAGADALGNLVTSYGKFYVYGNHDAGYYEKGGIPTRGYTASDIADAMAQNGVTTLTDDVVYPCDGYALIGRKDRNTDRMPIASLAKTIDSDKYSIVLDHQPGDYDNEAAAGVDLVLSGHTHGGQMIPITWVGVWLNMNDAVYGLTHRGNTDFITTSGISDWEIQFKSGCKSEIVIIDIIPN